MSPLKVVLIENFPQIIISQLTFSWSGSSVTWHFLRQTWPHSSRRYIHGSWHIALLISSKQGFCAWKKIITNKYNKCFPQFRCLFLRLKLKASNWFHPSSSFCRFDSFCVKARQVEWQTDVWTSGKNYWMEFEETLQLSRVHSIQAFPRK